MLYLGNKDFMMEFIYSHMVLFWVAVVVIVVTVWVLCIRRAIAKRRELVGMSATDLRELALIQRNGRLSQELKEAYLYIKRGSLKMAMNEQCGKLFSLHKWAGRYGDDFQELFVVPLTRRLEKDGFTVVYLSHGSAELKKHQGSPALEIEWRGEE